MTGQALLIGQSKFAITGAHGEDDRASAVLVAGAVAHDLHVAGEVDGDDVICDDFGTEANSLRAHLLHQGRSHNPVPKAGEILDLGGVHQGTTRGDGALEEQRRKLRAGCVDGSRVSGGTRADDDHVANVVSHVELPRVDVVLCA